MAKEAPGHAHNISRLNVVFAFSSIALFVATIWMVWADYSREWKGYQREFAAMERELTNRQIQEAESQVDARALERVEQELATAAQNLQSGQNQLAELQTQLDDLDAQWTLADIRERELKAVYDSQKFYFEEVGSGHAPLGKRVGEEEFRALENEFIEARDLRISLDFEREQVNDSIRDARADLTRLSAERENLMQEATLLRRKASSIAVNFPNVFRNMPVVDFIDPTVKIQQVLVQNVTEDLNFAVVPRIDRCMTCHLGIGNPDYADAPQPFTTHPNLDMYVSPEAVHSQDNFGCTSCHEGRGRSTTFVGVVHTPQDDTQQEEWERKYDWVEDHYWDKPMYPNGYAQAGCQKCHGDQVLLAPDAEEFNESRMLYEAAGCWGCHNTDGFEDLRKVGPNLEHVASKVTEEWAMKWVRDPKSFKLSNYMPRFWDLDNNLDAEVGARNATEIVSIVSYVFDKAKPIEFDTVPAGNAARGQEFFESLGCTGCHIVDESFLEGKQGTGLDVDGHGEDAEHGEDAVEHAEGEDAEAADSAEDADSGPSWFRTRGASLVGIGSKVSREFLYDWIRNPKHYWEETYMPDLRLTDGEAADITAYLMTLRNETFEAMSVPQLDTEALDVIALEFLMANLPMARAQEQLAGMSQDEKKIYAGEGLIRRYGCFGCHDIEGFENAQKIGVDLSSWGSKMVSRLDFGYQHDIEHSRRGWLEQKLSAPRSFDIGKVKSPPEKLRMGYFGFTEKEKDIIARKVLGQVRTSLPQAATKNLSASEAYAEQGRRIMHAYNCRGCHLIDGYGGGIYETIEDTGMRPPNLNTQGARTQPDWLFHFLKEPSTVRSWLNVRMPTFQFDDAQTNTLVTGFMAQDGTQPFDTAAASPASAETLRAGDRLLQLQQCERCHVADAVGVMEASQLAPSFRLTGERLREEWIVDWMKDPQSITPGTNMPQAWPLDGDGNYTVYFPDILDGDAEAQMRAVASYLMRYTR